MTQDLTKDIAAMEQATALQEVAPKKRYQPSAERLLWQGEFHDRVDVRFAELIQAGAFTRERQDEVTDYIDSIRARGFVTMSHGRVLAKYLYDCPYWLLLGEHGSDETMSVANPYPPAQERLYNENSVDLEDLT